MTLKKTNGDMQASLLISTERIDISLAHLKGYVIFLPPSISDTAHSFDETLDRRAEKVALFDVKYVNTTGAFSVSVNDVIEETIVALFGTVVGKTVNSIVDLNETFQSENRPCGHMEE